MIKRTGLKIIKKNKPKLIPEDCEIIKFLENITDELNKEDKNKNKTIAILTWLSYYFIHLKSTNTALVLDGNKKFSINIFWTKIIQPIFGYRYTITIDDEVLKNDIDKILNEKVFYHIDEFTPTSDNINKLSNLLQAVLLDKSLVINGLQTKKIPVYGQVLITSKQSALHLKKYIKYFEYINIEEKENTKIQLNPSDKNLDIFSTYLSLFYTKNEAPNIINSIDKLDENNDAEEVENSDTNIDLFINAIKNKDLQYFNKVKEIEDGMQYEHMKNAFEKDDGYFISQDIYLYYTNVINKPFYKKKQDLMNNLKEKDKMFKQEVKILKILTKDGKEDVVFSVPSGGKATGNKYLYKITDYKLAEDIKIPDGATVISSQENLAIFTFTSKSEEEKCIQRTKEFRDKKKKEKEKIKKSKK